MDFPHELSSSEDEFCFDTVPDEIRCVHKEISEMESYKSDEDDDKVVGARTRKMRIIYSESESDSDSPQTYDKSEWTACDESKEIPPRIKFTLGGRLAGPHVPSNVETPLDFFKLFFTDELVDQIIIDTNKYAAKKLEGRALSSRSVWQTWYNVTKEEFWAFIAVIINMGTMPLSNIKEYWSTDPSSHIPFFANTFTRDRFAQIFWMLHAEIASARGSNTTTRSQLITGYLDYINSRLLDYFTPSEEICVDECVVKFKGRISFITYNPQKPTKWGIRIYALADSNTGYICGILPYYGSLTTEKLLRPDLSVSTRIPLHLYTMILNKIPGAQGYHMFTARYYTSYILANELHKLKCHLTGTILSNRKDLPDSIKKIQFPKEKSMVAYRRNNNVILAWKDKRIVTLLTNYHNAEMSTVERMRRHGVQTVIKKPIAIINYTKFMGGVDLADQYCSTYCFMRKSLKWWRKLFFWGMEICIINSYILYKQVKRQRNEQPLSHLQFRKLLVNKLRGEFRQPRDRVSRSTSNSDEIRLNGKLHVILTGTKKDCKVCSTRNKPGERHETTYYCDTCPDKPRMHLGQCFINFHTKRNYR